MSRQHPVTTHAIHAQVDSERERGREVRVGVEEVRPEKGSEENAQNHVKNSINKCEKSIEKKANVNTDIELHKNKIKKTFFPFFCYPFVKGSFEILLVEDEYCASSS